MKEHHCRHIALDCWVNDLMAADDEDRILSDEGFEALKQKYEKEIADGNTKPYGAANRGVRVH